MSNVAKRSAGSKAGSGPAPNGKPAPTATSRRQRIAAIRAEVAAIQKNARDELDREKEAKRVELEYLRALVAHPAAQNAVADVVSLMNQQLGGRYERDAEEMVVALVIIEAMKALREKTRGIGGAS